MKKLLFLIFPCILILWQQAICDTKKMQNRLWLLERYEHTDVQIIIDTVRVDLLSNDVMLQDAGCLVLLKALDELKKGNKKAVTIFTKLSNDHKVIVSVSDIIESRLLGWYNPQESSEIDDDIRIYVPLFVILNMSESSIARHTLSLSLLYLRDHEDILEHIQIRQELATYSIRRLRDIQSKYCCVYPGKETVVDMMSKDYRYRILVMFENVLKDTISPDDTFTKEILQYVIECMKYGDSKNGYVIRITAINIAGMLITKGNTELIEIIKNLSTTDPFYVHVYLGKFGFSLTELNYPVRDACRRILAR